MAGKEFVGGFMFRSFMRIGAVSAGILGAIIVAPIAIAQGVPGVAPGIPEPDNRNVIIQLFNWRFNDIKAVIPTAPEDPLWQKISPMTLPLSGQVITRPVWATPSATLSSLSAAVWGDASQNSRIRDTRKTS